MMVRKDRILMGVWMRKMDWSVRLDVFVIEYLEIVRYFAMIKLMLSL